jgi:hypothetical protein
MLTRVLNQLTTKDKEHQSGSRANGRIEATRACLRVGRTSAGKRDGGTDDREQGAKSQAHQSGG